MSTKRNQYYLLITLIISLCRFVESQNGDFAGGIANAILSAIFPDLTPQQNSLLNLPQSALPQGQNNFFRQQQTPQQASVSQDRQPVVKSPPTILNNGAANSWPPKSATSNGISSNLPPVDFVRGFPPTFNSLTNPDYQNSFLYPSGLQGRTDLPPSYVYPFAQPGSLITPASKNGELFSLGENKLPINSALQVQQQAPQAPLDPKYLFTGKPSGFSLSPALASLFNPLNASANFGSALQNQLVPLNSSDQETQKNDNDSGRTFIDSISQIYKKFKPPTTTEAPNLAAAVKSDLALLQQLFNPFNPRLNRPVPENSGQQPLPTNPVTRQLPTNPPWSSSRQQPLPANPISQQLPSNPVGQLPSVNAFPTAPWSNQFSASPPFAQFQQGPAQPAFAVQTAPGQPVLVQPQIFNQIFPQGGGSQFVQPGAGAPQLFSPNPNPLLGPSSFQAKKQLAPLDNDPDVYGAECPQCLSADIAKLSGPWVQVYGNPDALRTIYSTVSTLQGLYGDGTLESSSQSVQPVCVGFQFSRPHTLYDRSLQNGLESTLNLYFRDDSANRQLREVLGRIRQDPSNPKRISIKLPGFSVPMCAVKIGPASSTMYGYAILTETIGTNRCQSYHVLARDSDTFFRDYNRNVAEFLKSEVEIGRAKPLSVLPYPDLCQLQISSQILRKA